MKYNYLDRLFIHMLLIKLQKKLKLKVKFLKEFIIIS